MLGLITKWQLCPADTCTDHLMDVAGRRQVMVLSVCECANVCCMLGHHGSWTGLIRLLCSVARLPQLMVCWLLCHDLAPWTAALCHALSFWFFWSLFVIFSLFLRSESSGDSAAFLSTSRSLSGYTLLAAASWGKRSPSFGQQARRHPVRRCGITRAQMPPWAPHKVSACIILKTFSSGSRERLVSYGYAWKRFICLNCPHTVWQWH